MGKPNSSGAYFMGKPYLYKQIRNYGIRHGYSAAFLVYSFGLVWDNNPLPLGTDQLFPAVTTGNGTTDHQWLYIPY
jgi:hypothetical protein